MRTVRSGGSPSAGRRWPLLLPLLLFGVAAWMSYERALLVDVNFGAYASCPGCFQTAVFAADASLFGWVALLLGLAWLVRWRPLGLLLGLCATALVLAFAIDLVVFRILAQRLYLLDFLKFSKEVRASWSVANALFAAPGGTRLMIAAIAGVMVSVAAWPWYGAGRRGLGWILVLGAAALFAFGWLYPTPQYVHSESFRNVLAVNAPSGVDRAFSPEFQQRLKSAPTLPRACEPGLGRKPDIVVLALESVSTYHSKLVSGLWDATPNLDRLAAQGSWFSNFYANGFHTNGGLIALFGGRLPSPSIHRYSSLDAYTGFERPELDFYAELRKLGYDSEFFTTGTLAFQGRGQWLETMGFEGRHGADEKFYDGMRRWQFDAAEDSALVARFVSWLDERKDQRPIFAAVLTVTSHPPFIEPRSGRQDELGTFRYVDEQAAALYAALEQRGFFEHGILFVLGDHRSMTPIKPGEYERYGESAYARVPAFVFGQSGLPAGRIDQPFQQTDLIPSVLRLAGDESCRTPAQGAFLGGAPSPARYVLHSGGLHRDRIDVFHDGKQSSIQLDGDQTRWLGPAPPDGDAILAEINRDRAARAPLQEDLLDYFIQIFAAPKKGPE